MRDAGYFRVQVPTLSLGGGNRREGREIGTSTVSSTATLGTVTRVTVCEEREHHNVHELMFH